MKRLRAHVLDPVAARRQLASYGQMLAANTHLSESKDVLPFFGTNPDLCLLFSHYIPAIKTTDVLATEFVIYGDFRADLIVGDRGDGRFLLVEFEDGAPSSIFRRGTRTVPDWSPRLEGAFSQLVDWLWKLDDMRATADFIHVFGRRGAAFSGLIVTGHGMSLDLQEMSRLRWREEKVRIDSKAVSVISYDEFLSHADHWLRVFYRA